MPFESSFNFDSICRLCLSSDKNLADIFNDEPVASSHEWTLVDKILDCTSLQVRLQWRIIGKFCSFFLITFVFILNLPYSWATMWAEPSLSSYYYVFPFFPLSAFFEKAEEIVLNEWSPSLHTIVILQECASIAGSQRWWISLSNLSRLQHSHRSSA